MSVQEKVKPDPCPIEPSTGERDPRERHPVDVRPHFVIPYWTSPTGGLPSIDNGQLRPLPGGIISYLCSGIHASAYSPGQDLTVSVDVCNFGDGNSSSLARVTVWWTDPTTGFVIKPEQMVGFTIVPVAPRGGRATTSPMTARIPPTAPLHACLIASVSHPLDIASTTANPAGDRHWAQRNLSVVAAQSGIPVMFTFVLANPFPESEEFQLEASVVHGERLRRLAARVELKPIQVDARLSLRNNEHASEADARGINLKGHEQRRVTVTVDLGGTAPGRNEFVGVELVQTRRRGEAVGSLGIIIRGE